jgi:hypothetical protein
LRHKVGAPAEMVTANRAQPECPVSPEMVRCSATESAKKIAVLTFPTTVKTLEPSAMRRFANKGLENFRDAKTS